MNKKDKQIEVRKMIQSHQIKLFSLLETRVKAPKMGDLYLNVCPGWCFTTNLSHHKGGRVIVAWDPCSFMVNIVFTGDQIIHCYITPSGTSTGFFCSFIYGMNDKKERSRLLDQLRSFAAIASSPWVIMGDFNALMSIEDMIGAQLDTLALFL